MSTHLHHRLPLGTKVSFEGDSNIYIVDSYKNLLGPCGPTCTHDHDCYREPHITVRQEIWTSLPLSKLKHIFDDPIGHYGRVPTQLERTPL